MFQRRGPEGLRLFFWFLWEVGHRTGAPCLQRTEGKTLAKVLRELRDIKNKIIYVEADVKRIKRQVNA